MSARIAVGAEDLRTVLHHEPHCHTVPDRWDWGGGPCGVCEARARLKEALHAPPDAVEVERDRLAQELDRARHYISDLKRDLRTATDGLELMYKVRDRQAGELQEAEVRLSEALSENAALRNRLAAPEEFERARIQALLSSPLLAALRCIPDGTHQSGCVIHDGAKVRERVRQAYLAAFPRPNPITEEPS